MFYDGVIICKYPEFAHKKQTSILDVFAKSAYVKTKYQNLLITSIT
jgi:hypothetical protein